MESPLLPYSPEYDFYFTLKIYLNMKMKLF